jgi:hypothetical protein
MPPQSAKLREAAADRSGNHPIPAYQHRIRFDLGVKMAKHLGPHA